MLKKKVLPYSNMRLFFSEESNCKDTNNPGPGKKKISTVKLREEWREPRVTGTGGRGGEKKIW